MPLTTQNPPFSYGSTREASFLKSTGRLASVVSVIKDIIKIILKSRTRENCKIAMGEKKKHLCKIRVKLPFQSIGNTLQ